VKLPEGSRRKRRTPFLREEAEGRAFFKTSLTSGASFGKPPVVKLPEGRSLPSESRHPARGEAFRRKPPEVKLPEGRSESRRTCFFQNKFASFGFLGKAARGEASRRTFASFGKPPEVKLSEGSRRKPSFFQKAEGRAFFKTSSLPSESRQR